MEAYDAGKRNDDMSKYREQIKDKKRIVVKIGYSSLTHSNTGDMDYILM